MRKKELELYAFEILEKAGIKRDQIVQYQKRNDFLSIQFNILLCLGRTTILMFTNFPY